MFGDLPQARVMLQRVGGPLMISLRWSVARERDLVDAWVLDDHAADARTRAGDHIEDTRRRPTSEQSQRGRAL